MKFGENEVFEIPATISESIFKHLKDAIITGKLKPNERITERKIARIFKVSPTPVREAFQRLAAESLITINARREVTVTSTTTHEIIEIFEVLRINDIHATKLAIKNLSDNDIFEIKKLTKKMEVFYKQNRFDSYYKINLRVHDLIWKRCGNKHLYQTLSNLSQKLYIHKNKVFEMTQNPEYFAKSYQDHAELLKAVEGRDTKLATKILSTHWKSGLHNKKEDLHKTRKR